MIHTPEGDARDRTLHHYLGDRAREMQAEARGLLDVAASRRSSARRLEDPIRKWETHTRVHPLKGTEWESSLKDLILAISAASSVYREIYEAEGQALPILKGCVESIRKSPSDAEQMIPNEVLTMLEAGANLRSDSLISIERSLAVSSQIGAFTTRSTTQDVLSLLDDRSRAIAESQACRNRADAVEQRAFRLDTDRVEDLESAAVRALGGEHESVGVQSPSHGTGPDPFVDEEWETWLRFVQDDFSADQPPRSADAKPPAGEFATVTVRLPVPVIRATAGGEARQVSIDRLRAAEARWVEATAARDRALAQVSGLTTRVDVSTT